MTFLNNLNNLFFGSEKKLQSSNNDVIKVFSILNDLTKESSIRDDFNFRLTKILSTDNPEDAYIKLYFDWENYVINLDSISGGMLNTDGLRKKIREDLNIHFLPYDFGIIFEKNRVRFAHIVEKFINDIVKYIASNLGDASIADVYKVITEGTDISSIVLKDNTFDFSDFNKNVLNDVSYTESKLISLFKVMFEVLSERIEVSFGQSITKKLFNDVYAKLQSKYTSDFVSDILKVIPERVLSLDEWLSKLSKSELEVRVKEKTHELENIASELEKKVEERTRELSKAFEDLKVLDDKKSEFIYLIAHQMRTPLVSIKWALSILKDGDMGAVNKEQEKVLMDAYNANERMNKTINEILVADDLMNQTLKFESEPIDIMEIIRDSISSLDETAKLMNVAFELHNAPESKMVFGEKEKLKMVFVSVLDNALRYSPPQGKVIVTFVFSTNGLFSVKIEDSGIGIPVNSISRVGEKFFRADNALKQNTYGTGLGLFIVNGLMKGFGGQVDIQSQEGKGTKVTLSFKEVK